MIEQASAPPWRPSRRLVLAGGASVALTALTSRAGGQPASGETSPDGFRVLRARSGQARLRGSDKPPTPIWGYDGRVPGPPLRVKRGEELKVRLINELPQPTTIHWHGLRLPNAMDGVPHLTQHSVAPGQQFDYRFKPPDAGTFWYHAHFASPEQVERGLQGMLIVDEPTPPDVDRDVALTFDDWLLNADGTIDGDFRSTADASHAGRLGDHFTVNAQHALDIPVRTNERIRLRLLNAANSHLFAVTIEQHRPVVIAIDGQPAEPYVARDARIVLAPGNRVDLALDATLAPGSSSQIMIETTHARVVIARLVYEAGAPARPAPRAEMLKLPPNPLPERMDFKGALKLDLPLDGGAMRTRMGSGNAAGPGDDPYARIWTIAGKSSTGHDGAPLFSVKRGRTVMLALPNRSAFPHAMHVHGHHFRLLDALDDGWKPFWLDTVLVLPAQTARIAFVADNAGKWMFHCHMLEHQESGMAAWFAVT